LGGSQAAALIWIMPFRIRDRVVGRAHRYRSAIRHPALLGENSPVGSVLINKCRPVGRLPTSRERTWMQSMSPQAAPWITSLRSQ
jgi:hypothetical protein